MSRGRGLLAPGSARIDAERPRLPSGIAVVGLGRAAAPASAATRRPAAIRTLAVDAQTAEVMSALDARGVEALLLKGPALARLLYTDGEERYYGDSDVLVPPRAHPAAEQTLHELGFERELGTRSMALVDNHGYPWRRPGSRLAVDLHHTLTGVGADPDDLWEQLQAHIVSMEVQKTAVPVPDVPALAFHAALHAAQHGLAENKKPVRDLERALERIGMRQWGEAAELAERVDAVDAFGLGLRLLPQGEALAGELRLPPNRSRQAALRAMGSPTFALVLDRLSATAGARARATLVLRKTWPPPDFMRHSSPLARKGRTGLVLAYLRRLLSVLCEAPSTVRAWRRANRETETLPTEGV